jgi:hypothetical protein
MIKQQNKRTTRNSFLILLASNGQSLWSTEKYGTFGNVIDPFFQGCAVYTLEIARFPDGIECHSIEIKYVL